MWIRSAVLCWLILGCCVGQSSAWNDLGHYTVAKIAYDQLSTAQRENLHQILRAHPHYSEYLAANRPDSVALQEWVVWRAATWSDWIRPPKDGPRDATQQNRIRFHRGPWHYINYPYRAGKNDLPFPEALPNRTNVIEQIGRSAAIVRQETTMDDGAVEGLTAEQNRAVRLCWLFHLVGDLHQPLHAAALIDEQRFPGEHHDDLGGNRLAIRPSKNEAPLRLHWYWDQLLGTTSQAERVQMLGKSLPQRPEIREYLESGVSPPSTAADWARESYELAKTFVYLKGELPVVLFDEFEAQRITADQVPILPAEAAKNARELAERRVVQAGFRLARILR